MNQDMLQITVLERVIDLYRTEGVGRELLQYESRMIIDDESQEMIKYVLDYIKDHHRIGQEVINNTKGATK